MKIVIVIACVVLCIVLALTLWLYNFFNIICIDSVVSETSSINNQYIATLFQRDCGATTSISTIVSIRDKQDNFAGDRDDFVFVVKGEQQIDVKWVPNNKLQITSCETNVFIKKAVWNGIRIEYVKRNHAP